MIDFGSQIKREEATFQISIIIDNRYTYVDIASGGWEVVQRPPPRHFTWLIVLVSPGGPGCPAHP